MQRVHEEHGRVAAMTTLSRRLLPTAALLILLAALVLNLQSGGSSLTVAIFGLAIISVVLAWYLFEASSRSKPENSSLVKAKFASGQPIERYSGETQHSELPDPIESGFEIPLM